MYLSTTSWHRSFSSLGRKIRSVSVSGLQKDVEVRDLIPIGEDFPELENSFMICIQLRPALLLVQANQSLPSGAIIIFDPRRSRISFLRSLILIQFVIRKSEENVASAKGRARLARVKLLGIDRGTHAW